jgi:hypothetical protein
LQVCQVSGSAMLQPPGRGQHHVGDESLPLTPDMTCPSWKQSLLKIHKNVIIR